MPGRAYNNSPTYEPIRTAFKPAKASSWLYKIHPYFTRQPLNIVEEYIKHFCPVNGVVLDPFCGSGVVGAAALANGRKAICMDIDPLACFITKMTCLPKVNLNDLDFWFDDLHGKIKDTINLTEKADDDEIRKYKIEKWFPKNVRLPANADKEFVEELFTKRQLIVMSHLIELIREIPDEPIREILLFAFSAALDKMSIMYRAPEKGKKHGGGSGLFLVYRYWVPSTPGSKDVWKTYSESVRRIYHAKKQSNTLLRNFSKSDDTFRIYNDSADALGKYVKESSIDYIFTDPPYGAHIAYTDLSTMYRAWLRLPFNEKLRQKEAIEGGDLDFNRDRYLDILSKSFQQMFIALKDDGWLSLVYFHKDHNLWYSIRDMMRYIGFTYVNVVAQPLSNKSFHKAKRPLRVLGESLIVNFQKSKKRRISVPLLLPVANLIRNVAERVIYRNNGASTEEILRDVVADLFDNDMFFDAASKKMNDMIGILESDFDLDTENLWQIKSERKVGNFIPPKLRIKYYVIGYLRKVKKASFDDIITTILPLLINGHKPSRDDIANVLREVAASRDGITWELVDTKEIAAQVDLPFPLVDSEITSDLNIPESTVHNQHIYRLAVLCRKFGYVPYIGKNERNDPMFTSVKPLVTINITADEFDVKRIEQVDITWLDNEARPVWAFEVEESTSILSALERFVSLLKAVPHLGRERQLTIVAPKSRKKKLMQELSSSSYIGHPLYLDNKISYLFTNDLEELFSGLRLRKTCKLSDLKGICKIPGL